MISILCPSRGRPLLAKRMIDSALKNSTGNIELLLYLNDNDPELNLYRNLIDEKFIIVGPDRSPCYSWNMLATIAKYDYLFLAGDDIIFSTYNWDGKILEKFINISDKIACVYPRAPQTKSKKNPHFCLHKNWMTALGYFVPPHFWHWYVDTWTAELAKHISRYILVEDCIVDIEKFIDDNTTQRTNELCLRERDIYLWNTTQAWLDFDKQRLVKYIKDNK